MFIPGPLPDDVMMPGAERAIAGEDDTLLARREKEELAADPPICNAEPAAMPFELEEEGCGEKLEIGIGTPFILPIPEGPAELGALDAGPCAAPPARSSSLESRELSSKRFSPDPDLLAPEFAPPELDAAQKSSEFDPSSGNLMSRLASGAPAAAAADDTLS